MGGFLLRPRRVWYLTLLIVAELAGRAAAAAPPPPPPEQIPSPAVVSVDGSVAIARTDHDFVCATIDWWPPTKCDYGTCSWGSDSLLNVNLSSHVLLNAVKAFSPLKIRLGGTLQDKVIYDTGDPRQPCTQFIQNSSEMFGFTQGCLPLSRWDELNAFFRKAGAEVIFGLNALNGRVPMSDGSVGGPWNSTNAASLIRYTVKKGYRIRGWEFGNELSGNGIGERIDADQYAADVIALKLLLHEIYNGFPVKPLVLAPAGFFLSDWFSEFITKAAPNWVDVITHHIYNLGPGVDDHLVSKILDPDYLNGIKSTFGGLRSILKGCKTSAVSWVGEAGGAYNSGRNLVTNTFVFSFWYLDQLGMSSAYDTKTYCRQTLIGGNYGLLDTITYKPNPDYYSALLWHRLMGENVLATNFNGSKKIRAYSHCAKESPGIVLLFINLDGNTSSRVDLTREVTVRKSAWPHKAGARLHHPRTFRPRKTYRSIREEYHLTAGDGNLESQTMMLNNKALELGSNGKIPPLEPVVMNASEPITVAPFSIVFAHIPHFRAPACK